MDTRIAVKEWPVTVLAPKGARSAITQEFKPRVHLGVDISVPGALTTADAVVRAVAAGSVNRAFLSPRGHMVLLDHGGWASAYLHLSSLAVSEGQRVEAGEVLGAMGADPMDGEHIVHLHLQLSVDGQVVDPAPYLAGLTRA